MYAATGSYVLVADPNVRCTTPYVVRSVVYVGCAAAATAAAVEAFFGVAGSVRRGVPAVLGVGF